MLTAGFVRLSTEVGTAGSLTFRSGATSTAAELHRPCSCASCHRNIAESSSSFST